MKTKGYRCQGNVLFAVMIVIAVVGILLIGYLSFIQQRSSSVGRSQSWNLCVPVAEAGLEEAMAHLNHTKGTNMVSNGWTSPSTNVLIKTYDLGTGRYAARISNSTPAALESETTVESQAIVKVHGTAAEVTRRLKITARVRPEIRGLVAQNKVTIADFAKANSYDSREGPYNPLAPRDNAFIGNNSLLAQQMEITGAAKIYGDVGCGVPAGLKLVLPAVVGDAPWVNNPANAGNVELGHYTGALNVPIWAILSPFSGMGSTLSPGNVGGTNYTYVLNGGNYKVNGNLTLDLTKTMIVTADSTLWVTDTFYVKDMSSVIIAPGARLKLYMGKQFYMSAAAQMNAGGFPDQLAYYGLTSNAEFYMSDFSILSGIVYSPGAKMDLSGNAELFGGGACKELIMKGNSQFHYDEALGASAEQPFLITSWTEYD